MNTSSDEVSLSQITILVLDLAIPDICIDILQGNEWVGKLGV